MPHRTSRRPDSRTQNRRPVERRGILLMKKARHGGPLPGKRQGLLAVALRGWNVRLNRAASREAHAANGSEPSATDAAKDRPRCRKTSGSARHRSGKDRCPSAGSRRGRQGGSQRVDCGQHARRTSRVRSPQQGARSAHPAVPRYRVRSSVRSCAWLCPFDWHESWSPLPRWRGSTGTSRLRPKARSVSADLQPHNAETVLISPTNVSNS